MEELDRPLDARDDGVGHLDHDAHVLRQHHVFVGRAAVAKMIAELDGGRHAVADFGEHVERLGAEIDRAFVVVVLPGQHLLADVPLDRDAVVRQRFRDLRDFSQEMLHQRLQQLLPVRRHHVVVGRRHRRWDRDLEFDARRNVAGLLHAARICPRLDRHVGVAGVEGRGIDGRAGLHAQPRDLTHHLAVPLHELERRHVGGELDRRSCRTARPAGTGSNSCGCRFRRPAGG